MSEAVYTLAEVADELRISYHAARRIFLRQPGVLNTGTGSKVHLRIPQPVLERVRNRMMSGGINAVPTTQEKLQGGAKESRALAVQMPGVGPSGDRRRRIAPIAQDNIHGARGRDYRGLGEGRRPE